MLGPGFQVPDRNPTAVVVDLQGGSSHGLIPTNSEVLPDIAKSQLNDHSQCDLDGTHVLAHMIAQILLMVWPTWRIDGRRGLLILKTAYYFNFLITTISGSLIYL